MRIILRMTTLALLVSGVHLPEARAIDPIDALIRDKNTGLSRVPNAAGFVPPREGYYGVRMVQSGQPAYVATGPQQQRPVNPTYWTWMPIGSQRNSYCDPSHSGKGVWTLPAVRWILDPDYYAYAPDYGWSPPGKRPVIRQDVVYQRYYPDRWYGQKGAGASQGAQHYPAIATPTDTSQLGYYYQKAPSWQPMNILPQSPHPAMWHVRENVPGADGTYTRWVPLTTGYVMQGTPSQAYDSKPVEVKPDEQNVIPVPIPEELKNAPEALNNPEIGTPIRRASF